MSYFKKCMEEISRDEEQSAHNRAIEEYQRMMQTTQLVAGMARLEEDGEGSRGSRSGRAPNRDRKRHDRGKNLLEDYFIPRSVYPEEEFRRRYRMALHLFNRIMADVCNVDPYFVQKPDAIGVMGLLPEQKMTAVLRMLAYGASADQVDEIARLGDSTALKCLDKFCKAIIKLYKAEYIRRPSRPELRQLLQKGEQRGFPGMTGSIDCMHWEWKNCPTAWEGQFSNRKGTTTIILEAVASYDTRIWHAFFGVAGSQNDLNVLSQSDVFDDVVNGQAPRVEYDINGTQYKGTYYLADGIYPQWQTFVKTIPRPRSTKEKLFSTKQEAYRKDVERCFGILQARWGMVRRAARLFDEYAIGRIMTTCIILHNMIVEDEFDYDSEDFLEEDPFNSSRTKVYDLPLGPDGQPLQHPPVGREEGYVNRCVQRYTSMHTNIIHRQRQQDLIEHIWNEEGDH